MKHSKTTYLLSYIIILLSILTSAGGLCVKDLYRDNGTIKSGWLGNDIITLILVVPALTVAVLLSKKESKRAHLIWMGLLSYIIYNYAFYLFGAAFNKFFLVYVTIFSLSIYALILGLSNLETNKIKECFSLRTPVKWISIFLLFTSLPLAIVEIGMCLNFLISGEVPPAPSLIFALDLSIVVPNTVLAAFLLWKKRPWGFVLAAIMLVKAFTYGAVLTVATTITGITGTWDPLIPFYVFITIGGFIFLIVFLKNLETI